MENKDYKEKLARLQNSSKMYNRQSAFIDTELSKIFNRGMGNTKFIEVLPEENVILYNTTVTNKLDLERINEVFEDYKLVAVDLPYWANNSLKSWHIGVKKNQI